MKKLISHIILPLGALLAVACESTTTEIGSTLIEEESKVIIHNEFSLTGATVDNEAIESRTTVQLLGDLDAKGYGRFTSDFVCQFMPASRLVTSGVTAEQVDSMKLIMVYANGSYVGDSIAPMGLEVYRLNRQLPTPIFSSFDPSEYYDATAQPLASHIYVGNAQGATDSIKALNYREIKVDLPVELARELFTLYVNDPDAYSFPDRFAKHFPGIYVRNSFGAGRVTQITRTTMEMYYHTTKVDSEGKTVNVPHTGEYYAVTPEVVSNNNISFSISNDLEQRISAGESIIVAPVGRDVEITFPLEDVLKYYRNNSGPLAVVNALSMKLAAEVIHNDYGIEPPKTLLMVLSSKKDEFFLTNSLTDDKTSFVADYNAGAGCYKFSSLRTYFLDMLDKYGTSGANIDPADITFTLTPVTVTTDTSSNGYTSTSYVSSITPYIGKPAMVRLNLSAADISFQFSKQSFE